MKTRHVLVASAVAMLLLALCIVAAFGQRAESPFEPKATTINAAPDVDGWSQIRFHIPKGKDAEVMAAWQRFKDRLQKAGADCTPTLQTQATRKNIEGKSVPLSKERKDCTGAFSIPLDKDPATIGAVMLALRDGVQDIYAASHDGVAVDFSLSANPNRRR